MGVARALTVVIAPALLLTACQREKSFDERYAEARKAITASAAAIDAEIASRASEAAIVEAVEPSDAPDRGGTGKLSSDRVP